MAVSWEIRRPYSIKKSLRIKLGYLKKYSIIYNSENKIISKKTNPAAHAGKVNGRIVNCAYSEYKYSQNKK